VARSQEFKEREEPGLARRDAWIALGLFAAALIPALWVARWMHFPEQATDPILNALLILDGGGLTHNHNPRFGYGRALSWLPLVAVSDGLVDLAMLRGAAAATLAPMAWLAARLLGASRLASASAGVALIALTPILENLRWGHEAYLSMEWAGLALVGFAMLAGEAPGSGAPDRWSSPRAIGGAVVLGVAGPMAFMNHPFAAGLLALYPASFLARGGTRRVASGGATLLALVLVLPHLLVVLQAGGAGSLARPCGEAPLGVAGARALLAGADRPAVLLLVAPLSAFYFGRGPWRWLAGATILGGLVVVTMAASVGLVSPWYWKPLIVPCAVCLAAAAGGGARREGLVLIGVVALFALGSANALQQPDHWSLQRADVIAATAATIDATGRPHALAGYGQADRHGPDALPFAIDAVLADALTRRLVTTPQASADAPQLVYLEGEVDWVEQVGAAFPVTPHLVSSPGGRLTVVDSSTEAIEIGSRLCRLSEEPVAYDDLGDTLPHPSNHGHGFDGFRPPGVADCAVRE